jgi:hypothetical protein
MFLGIRVVSCPAISLFSVFYIKIQVSGSRIYGNRPFCRNPQVLYQLIRPQVVNTGNQDVLDMTLNCNRRFTSLEFFEQCVKVVVKNKIQIKRSEKNTADEDKNTAD